MSKKLTPEQLEELRNWLNKFSLNKILSTKKLHRNLSDGVIVAMLLKEMYPKLVDLHNYSGSSSVKLKLSNWETLNYKVLRKLGIQQSHNVLDSISRMVPGYVEELLYTIMKNDAMEKQKYQVQVVEEDLPYAMNDEIVMINMNKEIGDAIIQVPQKMILYSIFEQSVRESKEKDVKMDLLYQKIVHLENIIELKNERIEELMGQVDKLTCRNIPSEESMLQLSPKSVVSKTQ